MNEGEAEKKSQMKNLFIRFIFNLFDQLLISFVILFSIYEILNNMKSGSF